MLSTPEPHESVPQWRNRPWMLHTCDPGHPRLANFGDHDAEFVRTSATAPDGEEQIQLWGTVEPGDEFNLCFCDEPEDRAIQVILAWFDQGSEVERSWTFQV